MWPSTGSKLVCGIHHSKGVIVVIGADEQCLLQGQKAGHPGAHAKVCVGTESESVLPMKYFGALRLLLVAFESSSSP